jgi:hypothetical protein
MSFDFDSLRRGQDMLAKVNEQAAKMNQSGGFQKDERYWRPELDKAGAGSAIIRLLPPPPGEDVPFVRKFSYGFKGPTGKWFIENCPSTIGLTSPVLDYNSALWNSGVEANKEIARKQKRRLGFIANIQVLKHPARPSDEGKVYLWEFGKKLFEKFASKMNPEEEDIVPVNPFDFWQGANFRLRVRRVEGFPNYEKSEFDAPSALSDSDEELKRIWKMEHSLQAEIAPDKFKSYEELEQKFYAVIGKTKDGQDVPAAKVAETIERSGRPSIDPSDSTVPWDDTPRAPTPASSDKKAWFQDLADDV